MDNKPRTILVVSLLVMSLLLVGFLTFGNEQTATEDGFANTLETNEANIPLSGGINELNGNTEDWEMKTLTGEESYLVFAYSGQEKPKTIKFENYEGVSQTITLKCLNGIGEFCEYITFEDNPISLSLARSIDTYNDFTIKTPLDLEDGEYSFAIVGTDTDGKYNFLPVVVRIKNGFFFNAVSKLTSNLVIFGNDGERMNIPYFVVFLSFWLIFSLVYIQLAFRKRKSKVPLGIISAFLTSFIILGFI